jgi:hypothetical protein
MPRDLTVLCQCLKGLPKIFVPLVTNGEFEMGMLSRTFRGHSFCNWICNFLQI